MKPHSAIWVLSLAVILAMAALVSQPSHTLLEPVALTSLHGWSEDDHVAALAAFRLSCLEIVDAGRSLLRPARFGPPREAWLPLCRDAVTAVDARSFFEDKFSAWRVNDSERPEGLFTGYYEPEAEGSRTQSPRFSIPVYGLPSDLVMFDAASEAKLGLKYGRLVRGEPQSYFTRREIEQGALAGRGLEIAWVANRADLFFMQVQGSGRLRLPDGGAMRLAYAGKTGLPYTAIGGVLVARRAFPREGNSMQAIRTWMMRHANEAQALMWENSSYVFFREVTVDDAALGAPGAQKVNLTPLRSLAVDRALWQFGTPVWLDAQVPSGSGETSQAFRHLLIAQDTGSAIKGLARGDVFWGAGETAAAIAGLMKSRGAMTVLLPKGFDPR